MFFSNLFLPKAENHRGHLGVCGPCKLTISPRLLQRG
jgi:hypothetical protein